MKSFKDGEGRPWEVRVNVATIKRVRDLVGIDLPGLYSDRMAKLAEFVNDPIKIVDTLYAICKDQADKRNLTDVQFGEAFSGDVLEAATKALLEDLADFSPSSKAKAFRAALAKMNQAEEMLIQRGMARVEATNVEAEVEKIIATLDGKSKDSSGVALES